jgi:serine protease SohB
MEWLYHYGFFLIKTITIVISILIIIAAFFAQAKKIQPEIEIDCLNEQFNDEQQDVIKKFKWKHIKKTKKLKLNELPKLFILNFNGDIKASQTEQLRDEITRIILLAQAGDEVMVKIDSPGGAVNGYGLAASQLERLRHRNIPLTVCIDRMAASGGYLMACIANKIYAAPFAIVGSIGVVAQLPNFNKWLKKHNIDFEQVTAGQYKRTLTMFGENTKEGRKKFTEDLETIHQNFKDHVLAFRPQLNIEKAATGEHWLAKDAMALGLIDELKTSDDYLLDRVSKFQIILLKTIKKPGLIEKILKPAAAELETIMHK